MNVSTATDNTAADASPSEAASQAEVAESPQDETVGSFSSYSGLTAARHDAPTAAAVLLAQHAFLDARRSSSTATLVSSLQSRLSKVEQQLRGVTEQLRQATAREAESAREAVSLRAELRQANADSQRVLRKCVLENQRREAASSAQLARAKGDNAAARDEVQRLRAQLKAKDEQLRAMQATSRELRRKLDAQTLEREQRRFLASHGLTEKEPHTPTHAETTVSREQRHRTRLRYETQRGQQQQPSQERAQRASQQEAHGEGIAQSDPAALGGAAHASESADEPKPLCEQQQAFIRQMLAAEEVA
mmetsp:Transcript_1586/g.2996  ORF Transcript_1586/g.2996 Transcript_1586/m.2996 type:complete len:305 (+) Transcript_1586:396-1310(+)